MRDENHGVGDASVYAEYRAFWRNDDGGEKRIFRNVFYRL
jgi:hypothetical protein